MKFCKNLQQVIEVSDPEWGAYWINYKLLKKLIKELPSLIPSEVTSCGVRPRRDSSQSISCLRQQQHGDITAEITSKPQQVQQQQAAKEAIANSPGEVAFFKVLHAELKKADFFFERATEEFTIREERAVGGMEITKQQQDSIATSKVGWSLMAKSIYRLYKELLLLEAFAIMTYCGFSKILKKHDKVSGYQTRGAFMESMVNKASFTNYPRVMEMISRCERLYEEVSGYLVREGSTGTHGLSEDERLFICMIRRLNEQVLSDDKEDDESEDDRIPITSSSKSPAVAIPPLHTKRQRKS